MFICESFSAEPVSLHEVTTSSEHRASEPQTCEKTSQEANEDQTHAPQDLCGVFKAGDVEIHLDFSKKKKEEEEQFDDSECEQFFIGEAYKDSCYIWETQITKFMGLLLHLFGAWLLIMLKKNSVKFDYIFIIELYIKIYSKKVSI